MQFIICIFLLSCQQTDKASVVNAEVFEAGISVGVVKDTKIREASGLVASRINPGMLWTHNDSGNDPDIFLIDERGEIKCTVHLSGTKNRDWEDITIGLGADGRSYIYVGDIGDNGAVHESKFIYRVEEPKIGDGVTDTTLNNVDKIEFKFSDGARDAEALMMDPVSKNFYVFSKRESRVNLYTLSGSLSTTEVMIAERVAEKLPFSFIVAANISEDGSEILAKNYASVFYWKRLSGESVEDAIKRAPETLPYAQEPQGESIAFDLNGTGYYTISERKKKTEQHLYFYKRN